MGHSAYDPATKGRPAWNAGLEAALRFLECERGPIEVLVYNAYRVSIRLPGAPVPEDFAAEPPGEPGRSLRGSSDDPQSDGASRARRHHPDWWRPSHRSPAWPSAFSLFAGKAALRIVSDLSITSDSPSLSGAR